MPSAASFALPTALTDGLEVNAAMHAVLLQNLIPQPGLVSERGSIPDVADDDVLLILDTSSGTLSKVSKATLTQGLIANTVKETLTMIGHGFVAGDVARKTDTAGEYVKAQADVLANVAGIIGVVESVPNVNAFTVVYAGRIEGLTGLTEGGVYRLSAATAGLLTTTPPAIDCPLLVATSATGGVIVPASSGGGISDVRDIWTFN